MPAPPNLNVVLGASFFGIVCAATLYVVEHFRQERRRQALEMNIARLDGEFSALKLELEALMKQQKEKNHAKSKRNKKGTRSIAIASSTTTEDYRSAVELDSSDLEFYDLSEDDLDNGVSTTSVPLDLDIKLKEIDDKLDTATVEELESCIGTLSDLCLEHPQNPHLLWRIGKAHYRITEKTDDKSEILSHNSKGIEACTAALSMKPELAEVHKWQAILIGGRSEFQSTKDRILDGNVFKEHLDKAVALDPHDSSLYHMLGRFDFEVAGLKWYEKKIASALFAEVPSATYEGALDLFLTAERLSKKEWKENRLMIAKCKLALGEKEEAVEWLEKAASVLNQLGSEDKADREITQLLQDHR